VALKKSSNKINIKIDNLLDEESINLDLYGFFKVFSQEKKREVEEYNSIVGDLELDSLFEEVSYLKKEQKVKRKKEEKTLKEFENILYEETSKEKDQIKEELIEKSLGLLAEPSNIKQQNDPLTPLNQKFATLEDLQKHYNLFLTHIQQQLSTLGGGGETNLTFMDVPVTSVTSSSYSVTLRDYYIGVNYAGAVTITLPYANREGKIFVVKDELGEASKGTNRYITILPSGTDLIDGEDRAILAYDYGSLTFIWKGNSWRVI
jgi:hypothetical protein